MRVRVRAEQHTRDLVRRVTGAERLQVAASSTRALARWAVVDDDDVAELGRRSHRPAVGLPAQDEPAADSRPEHEPDQVARAPPRADRPFRDRRRVAVVVDRDRDPEALLHPVAEVDVGQGDVDRGDRPAGSLIDRRGDAEADRRCVAQPLDHAVERLEQLLLRFERSRALAALSDRPVLPDDAGGDLRSTEVDADDAVFSHVSTCATD